MDFVTRYRGRPKTFLPEAVVAPMTDLNFLRISSRTQSFKSVGQIEVLKELVDQFRTSI
jgi:hypothetical protein